MATTYQYTVRPAVDTGKLIIAFPNLPEDKDFIKKLIRAFEPVNVRVVNYDDLWMNDEIALSASSDIGPFIIYRDNKGYYFITANDNLTGISALDSILKTNPLYKKT